MTYYNIFDYFRLFLAIGAFLYIHLKFKIYAKRQSARVESGLDLEDSSIRNNDSPLKNFLRKLEQYYVSRELGDKLFLVTKDFPIITYKELTTHKSCPICCEDFSNTILE